jgi:hypothetical protein
MNTPDKNNQDSSKSEQGASEPGYRPSLLVVILAAVALGVIGILWISIANGMLRAQDIATGYEGYPGLFSKTNSEVFSTKRLSQLGGYREYFNIQSTPVQPIAFDHKIHAQNDIDCGDCHSGATQGPDAGIPSVSTCMVCHESIDPDNSEIKKLAAYADKGQDVPWQPVFWFYPEVHVMFQHAPHMRNGIKCDECHGDMTKRTVAVKTKELTMNFCLNCHNAKGVSVDCITCHN